ncbi:Chromo domain-containing protein [Gossypium australe]|uniref:Chromo domain-containing protein n=1 Tax=Gossypium australe TaxID=47621 RepID=A0A5B6VCU3_9ROSI|nr:Chromo domain-containing protein [Gossypium australe]
MFGRKGKQSLRFIGPYKLELPPKLDPIRDVFHVSMYRRYCLDPSHTISINEVEILDYEVKTLRQKKIPLVKVLWKNHGVNEVTWEFEESCLLRKNVSFKWMNDQQASFEKLKTVLTQAPILIHPESRKKYVVYSGASYTSLRFVLM